MPEVVVLIDAALPPETMRACRQVCRQLGEAAGQPVTFLVADNLRIAAACQGAARADSGSPLVEETLVPTGAIPASPMTSAPFVYLEDGRPDWSSMWQSFCDLALHGGPPHRGEANALHAPTLAQPPNPDAEALAEIRRGVHETTGLSVEPAEPGWVGVKCDSPKMAAWLCACIILENVDARCAGDWLYLPASPTFTLKDEVKSVITVVAKTCHYWKIHTQNQ